MIFFFLLVLLVAAYASGWRPQLGQWGQAAGQPAGSADASQQILRERYARGEISREQYQEMRDTIVR